MLIMADPSCCAGCNYTDVLEELRNEFPDFAMRSKAQSWFMRTIGKLLWLLSWGRNNAFMTEYVTTIGYTVYVPDGWGLKDPNDKYTLLRHERIHMRQYRAYGRFCFSFLYLFFPLPFFLAYYRAKFEKAAYRESMRSDAQLYGVQLIKRSDYKAFVVKQFTSSMYLWMWPFKSSIESWYDETVKDVTEELER